MITGLNHITLAVTDLDRSITFYRDVLGFRLRAAWASGAYFDASGLWLCLSLDAHAASRPHQDYSHLAFDISPENYDAMAEKISRAAKTWKDNKSEGASLYFLDPDGHKLELHCGDLESRLRDFEARNREVTIYP
ncbi:VOC family protein [Paracoccaceae bacterium GXU_MW_L88]